MKQKFKKIIYKMNFKKTWPYFLGLIVLFLFISFICEGLALAVRHANELPYLEEELCYGISNFTAVFFFWGFLVCYLLCRSTELLIRILFECIIKRMRKDD